METQVINITERFKNAVLAEAKGTNVLILREREYCPDNNKYELEYRWLSTDISTYKDAEVCVLGQEFISVTSKEAKKILKDNVSLFDAFQLY